jgi:hypothetical protein
LATKDLINKSLKNKTMSNNSNKMKTIESLTSKPWYRLLKILYLFCFFIITFGWLLFGYTETNGNLNDFFAPASVSIFILAFIFWSTTRIFYYIVLGSMFPKKSFSDLNVKNTTLKERTANKEWSTDNILHKIILVSSPILLAMIGLLTLTDQGRNRFLVSLVYFLFAIVGWNNFRKRRVENKTWFLEGKWMIFLAWTIMILVIVSFILTVYILTNKAA